MHTVYLLGETVRLTAEFHTFDGTKTDIEFAKVIIYDYKYNKIKEVNLNESNKISTGVYFFDYIVDIESKKIIYEFYGELNGKPVLNRDSFTTKFIV